MENKQYTVLVINPGSTSTKTALYKNSETIFEEKLECTPEELSEFDRCVEQVDLRKKHVIDGLKKHGYSIDDLDAVSARGGPLRPVPGGVYRINRAMTDDARSDEFVEHVSKIACLIAADIAQEKNLPAFIVDPVSTDEFNEISRISGLKEVPRKSLVHALNMKNAARNHAEKNGKKYHDMNLITVQLGGGTSMAVHEKGRMIDSVDANGEGPFSPERSGGLRVDSLARFVTESGNDFSEIRKILTRAGGLMSHLGTTDARVVEEKALAGDTEHKKVYEAMAYAVSKHIAALSVAVSGNVDGILITGGLARSEMLTEWIRERVEFIAPVSLYPGEFEMEALRDGALRALNGIEKPLVYPDGAAE